MCSKKHKKGDLSKTSKGMKSKTSKSSSKKLFNTILISIVGLLCKGSDIHDSFMMYRDWIAPTSIEVIQPDRQPQQPPILI